jgi:hypothetical protein
MSNIVDNPIEFRCPVCGKLRTVLSGEGIVPPVPLDPLFRKDDKEYCQCNRTKAKK